RQSKSSLARRRVYVFLNEVSRRVVEYDRGSVIRIASTRGSLRLENHRLTGPVKTNVHQRQRLARREQRTLATRHKVLKRVRVGVINPVSLRRSGHDQEDDVLLNERAPHD